MTAALLHLYAVIGAGILGAGYALFLTLFIAPRISPAVPVPNRWVSALASGVVGAGLAWLVGSPQMAVLSAPLAALLVVPSLIDQACRRLPNAMIVHGLIMGVLTAVAGTFMPGATAPGWLPVIGWSAVIAAGVSFLLAVLSVTSRGRLGFGDVKYSLVLVFFLLTLTTADWSSPQLTNVITPLLLTLIGLIWLVVSFLAGSIYVIIRQIRGKRTPFAFGPWLAGGLILAFVGTHLLPITAIIPV